ncbi:MAG TPA: ABC transporter permease [Lapillicoccus sp.]|uniref:ABC transporter permease n=1 Tax=Lapillicoccus sp. TaxID=1909287 RepID=UPI002F940120
MIDSQPTMPASGVTSEPDAGGAAPDTPAVERGSTGIKVVLLGLKAGPLFILALLVVLLWASTEDHVFMTYGNIGNVLEQSAGVCVIALGQLMVILTRGIDLSIGSTVSLCCVICTVVYRDTQSAVWSILLTFVAGLAVGSVNGLILVKGRLPHPFIATLATLSIAAGLALYIADGSTIIGAPDIVDLFGGGRMSQIGGAGGVGWFPYATLVVLAVTGVCWVILRKLLWGRWIYAVGGSPDAAVRTGVPVKGVLISVYVLSGLSGAVGALLFVGAADAGSPFTGVGMELNAIAAVIIGGGSFLGGRGTVANALTGALILGVIHNGLNLLGFDPNWQYIATGVVIVLAVELDVIRAHFEDRFRSLQARLG